MNLSSKGERFHITGRGWAYVVPAPAGCEKSLPAMRAAFGSVTVDGRPVEIIAFENDLIPAPWREGQHTAIVVREVP